MTYLEMFIVVLAAILFSTTAVIQQQAMARAADLVSNASHTIQATQVALELLDSIDAKLFAPNLNDLGGFDKIGNYVQDYQNNGFPQTLEFYGARFQMEATAVKCNEFGDTSATEEVDKPNWLVTVRVWEEPAGGGASLQKHSIVQSRIYTQYKLDDF